MAKGLTLPLDEYATSSVDGYAWKVAVQDQWRSCMARYGFSDFGPPQISEQSAVMQADSAMGRRYGVSDLDLARKFGYHLPTGTQESPYWEPAAGAESTVFTGVGAGVDDGTYEGKALPEGGCRGEAQRMFPMPRTPEAERVGITVFEETRKSPEVVKAVAQWVSCMKQKGYERSHPLEDLGKLGLSPSSPSAGSEEIAHAVADVECKADSELVGVWNAKEKAGQQKAIKENASRLAKEKSVKDRNSAKVRQAYEAAGNQ
ncbi:hypothetical protein ACTU45_30520 [Streptomyces sp. 24-1644]|uniref:hypothetical protein n=1 Tax=Streptomyces sp. 24-1644 TaxID=3457315 RepID=UPI003FA6AA31